MADDKDKEVQEESSEHLKYQTCVLRVSIHCEGCKKKVEKALQRIEGVYTTLVDASHQKVTVMGNVTAEVLIKRLGKAGKHAEIISLPGGKSDEKEKVLAISNETVKPEKKEEPNDGEVQTPSPVEKKRKKKKKSKDDCVKDGGEIKEEASHQEEAPPQPFYAVNYSTARLSLYENPTQSLVFSPLPLHYHSEYLLHSFDEENADFCCVM